MMYLSPRRYTLFHLGQHPINTLMAPCLGETLTYLNLSDHQFVSAFIYLHQIK